MNLGVLFDVLVQGLKLWNTKEGNKYLDEVLKLQKEWLDEYNKPRAKRSNANLDAIEQQLHLISKQFTSAFRKSDV
jgi:hypothetical protein